jgi:predicted nuclease of predicted toxin-antitoxin system
MRILVDENIPRITVDALRSFEHDVKDVRGTASQGAADTDLWSLSQSESRLLITTDKGFTEYRTEPDSGILIVRLRQPNRQRIHHAVLHVIERFPGKEWRNLLVVVRDTTVSTSRHGGDPPISFPRS